MLNQSVALDGTSVEALSKGSEKRVELRCDVCGTLSTTTYANYYRVQEREKWSGVTVCRPCSNVKSGKAKRGKYVSWNLGKRTPATERERNPYIDAHGYRMVYAPIGIPDNSWADYRKEHVVLMEQALQRPLQKGESVHHIDGDKLNNRPENLWLCADNSSHIKAHQALQEVGYRLIQAGLIGFQNGTYTVAHVKLRELLEHLEAGNQQPSRDGDDSEGSETKGESLVDNNSLTSAGHGLRRDDIVQSTAITNETVV